MNIHIKYERIYKEVIVYYKGNYSNCLGLVKNFRLDDFIEKIDWVCRYDFIFRQEG